MAYDPQNGSVVVFQKDPTKLVGTVSIVGSPTQIAGSILAINMPSPSVIAYQAAGSILAVSGTFTASPQASINALQLAGSVLAVRTDNASIVAVLSNSSVAALQGTNPWLVNVPTPSYISYQAAGSILAVSGTFTASPQASINALQLAGSVLAVRTDNASIVAVLSNSSVAVLQGTNPWVVNVPTPSYIAYQLAGSVMQVTGGGGGTQYQENNAVTPSVVGNAILYKKDETNSVLSAVSPQHPLPVQGSITTLQGTNPWVVNTTTPSYIAIQAGGSILAVNMPSPSVIVNNTSVVVNNIVTGQSSVYLIPGVGVLGSVAALQGTNPWLIGNNSVLAFQGTTPWTINSILGTYQEKAAAGNASVLGQVILFKNNVTTSTLAAVSTLDPLPVIGSIATLQGTNPWITVPTSGSIIATQIANSVMGVRTDNASVIAVLSLSSVATLQGTNPWIVNVPTQSYLSIQPGGSVLNANISGSVAAAVTNFSASVAANINVISASIVTNQGTNPWVIGSIVGTYAEDAGHTTADKGLFVLGVRNDTMSSITSTDADYSPMAVGPVGENIVANAPITKWVQGATSVMSGTSVQVLAAPGTSIFTYITGIYVTNEASVASRVTITQGLGAVPASMVTWVIAPAGGGSNNIYLNPLRVLDNLGVSASINAVASIYITITGFTAKI